MTAKGFHDATTDVDQIDAWWTEYPEANIAFCPHAMDMGIVDLDGAAGEQAWLDVQNEYGIAPLTYTVATPRGGRHLYFYGELPPSQSRIADHIDTRGRGSYALVPPSRLDGWPEPYRVVDGRSPVELPEWLPAHPGLQKREKAKASTEALDLPGNIARARKMLDDYAKRHYVAVEGEMGDGRTFAVACEVLNLGLSEEMALELLDTVWNPHCEPPWDRDELAIKVSNAAAYAQNEAGAWATLPAEEVFGSVLDKLGLLGQPERAGRSKFEPLSEAEQDALEDPTWLFPGLLPDDQTVLLYGESGTYKSFVALDMAFTAASGIAGWGADARDPVDVVYIAGEGPRAISRKRRPAWKTAREVEGPIRFHIVDTMPSLGMPEQLLEMCDAIKAKGLKPRLIVVDTLARAMAGMNENDAKDAGLFIEAVEMVKRAFRCTVLVIHHAGKDAGRGARGSSALKGGFDAEFEVKAHKPTKALAIRCMKMKDADERETPWCLEGRQVGPSLVFYPITVEQHALLTADANQLSTRKVGTALAELNAKGDENFVTTTVLASHLMPLREGDDPQARQENVERMVRSLKARAKDSLAAYCLGEGRELKWGIPTA